MTKGFETFYPSHSYENNNSPLWSEENPFINVLMKAGSDFRSDFRLFGEVDEVTAMEKCVDFDDFSCDFKEQNWRKKHPCQWNEEDVFKWIMDMFNMKGLKPEEFNMSKFGMKGDVLCTLHKMDFEHLDEKYGGILFDHLSEARRTAENRVSALTQLTPVRPDHFQNVEPLIPKEEFAYPVLRDFESDNEQKVLPQQAAGGAERRPVGRPKTQNRRRSAKKHGRLWEFIRNMLHNPDYCPSIIRWVDHDKGLFKFERSDAVARVWGTIKKNPKMNYEKLSRAMRYYYKSKVFMAVEHQRLVYQFGPNAKGWQTDNPNFEKPISKL